MCVCVLPSFPEDLCWLGLTRNSTRVDFSWLDGRPYEYTNFQPGEPDEFDICAAMGSKSEWIALDRAAFCLESSMRVHRYACVFRKLSLRMRLP